MKIKTLIAGVLASLMGIALLGGCAAAPEPQKSPEEVLKEGMANLANVTSYKYDVALNGDMTDPVSGNVKFNLKMNGSVDAKDMKDPKISINLNGSASDGEGASGSVNGEMMMNKEAVYFNLKSVDLGEEGLLPPEMDEYMSKWWKITLPEGSLDEMAEATEEMAVDDEEIKKMLEDAKLFTTPQYVGTDNVMGDPSWHYKVNVDKKAFIEFAKQAAESQGEVITEDEIMEAEQALESTDLQGDVWISSTNNTLNQFSGSVTFAGGEGEPGGTINMQVSLGDINKPVTLSLPTAEEFPVMEFLGPLMMMGGMADPSMMMDEEMMMDDSMFDDSMMEDYDFDETMFEEGMMDEAMLDSMMDEAMADDTAVEVQ